MDKPWLPPLAILVAAPFIGSFIGLLAVQLPEGRPVVFGRSVCDRCSAPLGIAELVPILSWTFSGARCRHCGERISALSLLRGSAFF